MKIINTAKIWIGLVLAFISALTIVTGIGVFLGRQSFHEDLMIGTMVVSIVVLIIGTALLIASSSTTD